MNNKRTIAAAALLAILTAACSSSSNNGANGGSDDEAAVRSTVEASVEAENDKDVETFLALWTDKGLESYDVGSRADLEAGTVESFGENSVTIVDIPEVEVTGDTAKATVHATVDDRASFMTPLYQVVFELIRDGEDWKLDGFTFEGGAPASDEAEIVTVIGTEYAFDVDPTEAGGNFALDFKNEGDEAHEITVFHAPDGTDLDTAIADLGDVDGSDLEDLPEGYEAVHLAYAEPGQGQTYTFASEVEAGTYVLACYLPVGGLDEEGNAVDPDAESHFELGMVNTLTIA